MNSRQSRRMAPPRHRQEKVDDWLDNPSRAATYTGKKRVQLITEQGDNVSVWATSTGEVDLITNGHPVLSLTVTEARCLLAQLELATRTAEQAAATLKQERQHQWNQHR